jgi:hypothetical protein
LHRSRRNGLKRMGLLALALVLALGSLGVAYATWTDSVYVSSTVQTGTMDINAIASSSTFVYKVPPGGTGPSHYFINGTEVYYDTNGTEVHYCPGATDQHPPAGTAGVDYLTVASAVTTFDNGSDDPDTATMAFSGLFPGVDFRADLDMMYFGNIPVKVSMATALDPDKAQDVTIAALWQMGIDTKDDTTRYGIWMDGAHTAGDGVTVTPFDNPLGVRLDQFEQINITLHARLPEGSTYDNKSLSFSGIITVSQWNDCEETTTP